MAFTLEHVAIACGAFGVIAGIVSFGFLGIVLCLAFQIRGGYLSVEVRNAWLYRYPTQVVCTCALAATIWWDDASPCQTLTTLVSRHLQNEPAASARRAVAPPP